MELDHAPKAASLRFEKRNEAQANAAIRTPSMPVGILLLSSREGFALAHERGIRVGRRKKPSEKKFAEAAAKVGMAGTPRPPASVGGMRVFAV